MSAWRAVSVRKRSCTTVNRSSRREPPQDSVLVGGDGRRIGVVDVEGADRRVAQVVQGLPEAVHVDGAGWPRHESPPAALRSCSKAPPVLVPREAAAARFAVGADQGGKSDDAAHRHGAVAVAREAAAQPDEGAPGPLPKARAIASRVGDRQPGQRAHPLGRIVGQDALAQLGETLDSGWRESLGRVCPSRSSRCISPRASAPSLPGRTRKVSSAAAAVGVR